MSSEKVLVAGASGLVGKYISKELESQGYEVIKTDIRKRKGENYIELDITDSESVSKVLRTTKPEIVIYAANLAGGVDYCEKNKIAAKAYHFDSVVNITDRCQELDSFFIFFSTDYVFDGLNGPYLETDPPNPLNTYGLLKLMSEEYIVKHLDNHLIVRTTNVFGYDPESKTPNFVTSILRKFDKGENILVPEDQYGNPIVADNLVAVTVDLLRKGKTGLYNIAGKDRVNRKEWAQAVAETFDKDGSLIKSFRTNERPQIALRPLESGFILDKVMNDSEIELLNLRKGLMVMKSRINEG